MLLFFCSLYFFCTLKILSSIDRNSLVLSFSDFPNTKIFHSIQIFIFVTSRCIPQQPRQREPENLVVTHFVPIKTLLAIFWGIAWRKSTPRVASLQTRRNKNVKYFISSSENQTHNLSRVQSHACASASPFNVLLFLLQRIKKIIY